MFHACSRTALCASWPLCITAFVPIGRVTVSTLHFREDNASHRTQVLLICHITGCLSTSYKEYLQAPVLYHTPRCRGHRVGASAVRLLDPHLGRIVMRQLSLEAANQPVLPQFRGIAYVCHKFDYIRLRISNCYVPRTPNTQIYPKKNTRHIQLPLSLLPRRPYRSQPISSPPTVSRERPPLVTARNIQFAATLLHPSTSPDTNHRLPVETVILIHILTLQVGHASFTPSGL
jgi:hypothetical protein